MFITGSVRSGVIYGSFHRTSSPDLSGFIVPYGAGRGSTWGQ